MTPSFALEAAGISKRYGSREALRDVSLAVRVCHVHGLLGPNGAGKTTLMRVVLGLVHRDAGSVRLLGQPMEPTHCRVPDGVAGFVETPAFYPYLSARRNLSLLKRLDGPFSSSTRIDVDDALDAVGLLPHADVPVRGHSAGMRQRLGIAAALIRSPRLLFLDEPTSSLDPAGAHAIRALVRQLADEGVTVVLSSHDMTEVEELCASVTVINEGAVVFSGAIDELRALAPSHVYLMHTSDDAAALRFAARRPEVDVMASDAGGLIVAAVPAALDGFVIGLGCAGIAVRALESRERSLESLFLRITGAGAAAKIA